MRPRRQKDARVKLVHCAGRAIEFRYFDPILKRFVRRSSGTTDLKEAQSRADRINAELLLGAFEHPKEMTWREFVDRYDQEELADGRRSSRDKAMTVLASVTAILKPDLLADVANAEALIRYRSQLAAGKCSRFNRPRSPHTVKSYLVALLAALGWAERLGMIRNLPKIPRYKGATKLKAMKGRPIATEEFERMLEHVPKIVGPDVADSWKYLLRGLWESALRIEEAMNLSWDIPHTIRPLWPKHGRPTLIVPGEQQKNKEHDEIPLLPWFEGVLLEVPIRKRTGWIFEPGSLNLRLGRNVKFQRPAAAWVGKVISRIGESAGIVVEPARAGMAAKFASAHDLRRSCADRLEAAGVDPMLIARIMRHKSYETTRRHYSQINVQRDADRLWAYLVTNPDTNEPSVDVNP